MVTRGKAGESLGKKKVGKALYNTHAAGGGEGRERRRQDDGGGTVRDSEGDRDGDRDGDGG